MSSQPQSRFPLFITISGIIGAGKSTLATALANKLGLPVHYEPVENNVYLEDFYKDTAKHAFAMQIYLLNERFKQHQSIIWSGKGGVQDRSIYEDSIFAHVLCQQGLMSERDYDTYVSLFNNMQHFMQRPNIIVHLDVSPEESYRRIQLRSRNCESSVSLEYLTALHKAYSEFITAISKTIPVIHVNYELFPSVDDMVEQITQKYNSITNIQFVDPKPSAHQPQLDLARRKAELAATIELNTSTSVDTDKNSDSAVAKAE